MATIAQVLMPSVVVIQEPAKKLWQAIEFLAQWFRACQFFLGHMPQAEVALAISPSATIGNSPAYEVDMAAQGRGTVYIWGTSTGTHCVTYSIPSGERTIQVTWVPRLFLPFLRV